MYNDQILSPVVIHKTDLVADIIKSNYRTADVFLNHSISLNNDLAFTLEEICELKKLNLKVLIKELTDISSKIQINLNIDFENWNTIFVMDFILNIYHDYFVQHLPILQSYFLHATPPSEKSLWPPEFKKTFNAIEKQLVEQFSIEKVSFFPYIRQITNAEIHHEPFATLLVKTLKKPLQEAKEKEHFLFHGWLGIIRKLTDDYFLRPDASIIQQIVIKKMHELDNMIISYLFIKNDILFTRAIELENKLLGSPFTFSG